MVPILFPNLLYVNTGVRYFSLSDKLTTVDYNNPVGGVAEQTFRAEGIAQMAGIGLSLGKHAIRFVAGGDFSFNLYNYRNNNDRKNGIGLWPHADVLISAGKKIQLGVTGQAGSLTSPNRAIEGKLKATYYGFGINLRYILVKYRPVQN